MAPGRQRGGPSAPARTGSRHVPEGHECRSTIIRTEQHRALQGTGAHPLDQTRISVMARGRLTSPASHKWVLTSSPAPSPRFHPVS